MSEGKTIYGIMNMNNGQILKQRLMRKNGNHGRELIPIEHVAGQSPRMGTPSVNCAVCK